MNKYAIILFGTAALLFSCTRESVVSEIQPGQTITFTADWGESDATKTILQSDGTSVWWDAAEQINVFFSNKASGKFTSTNAQPQAIVDYQGSLPIVVGSIESDNPAHAYWAVYPYNAANTCDGESVTLTVPSIQTALEGTFANKMFPSIATSTNFHLAFYNICGGARFSVANEGISSITFKANNGESLVGKVQVGFDGVPVIKKVSEGVSEVTVNAPDGGFIPGKYYFATFLPQTLSKGMSLTFKKSDGKVASTSLIQSITINRSRFGKMDEKDKELEFKDDGIGASDIIVFADEKVKAKLVAKFDTNGDGELTYEEAAAVTSGDDIKSAFGAIKTYKSFDEFHFFKGVEDIPSNMFENWNLLTSIILPDSIKRINSEAFHNCVGLTEISIPESVIEIGYGCFNGCTNLQSIEIPDNVQIIQTSASYYNTTWRTLKTHNGAFDGCTSLLKVVLGKGITSISDVTFYNCVSLKTVEIHGNLKGIGNHAFENCSQLEGFTIPSTVSYIGRYAFQNCSSLSVDIIIPTGMNAILMGCFKGCSSIKSFMLPDGIHTIEHSAFEGCSSIKSFTIPESLSSLEMYLFSGCSSLSSIIIPETISSIGYGTFSDCSSLVSIIIPESVTSIGAFAFDGCTRLSNINIPESIMSIGGFAFSRCSSLTGINIPESITSIEDETFSYCSSISSITIPESVTHIGREAFRECKHLITISIPKSVTSIDGAAFYDCTGLTSVFVFPETPPSGGDSMFYSVSCPIFVPANSVVAYKSAKYWDYYANRIQAIP